MVSLASKSFRSRHTLTAARSGFTIRMGDCRRLGRLPFMLQGVPSRRTHIQSGATFRCLHLTSESWLRLMRDWIAISLNYSREISSESRDSILCKVRIEDQMLIVALFIAVYDEEHSQRSCLDYCFGYFMEWESAKRQARTLLYRLDHQRGRNLAA